MSSGSALAQRRLYNNSAIKFALGGVSKGPESASSNAISEESGGSSTGATREKGIEDLNCHGRPSSQFHTAKGQLGQRDRSQAHSARIPLRTIPVWVRSAEVDDLSAEQPSDYFLPNSPQSAFVAQHNHGLSALPTAFGGDPESFEVGNRLLFGHSNRERKSRWISFASPNAYPRENWQQEKVKPEWLNKHLTDYSKPWLADHDDEDVEYGSGRYRAFRRKRKTWYKRTQQTILRNPMIPLVFRMTVFTFSAVALALGGSIHRQSAFTRFSLGPSALMAIIVDAVALVYILYITYDEYTGKPLGLRPAKAKLRVILLDLFFIVFQSASLSLAFQTLSDTDDACTPGRRGSFSDTTDAGLCTKQKALASVLLIALIAWLNTFCVSILRLVERVVQR